MKQNLQIVDMFCGAGGSTTGLLQAAARLGLGVQVLAINHWEVAIATHAANHGAVRHICEPLTNIDPVKVVPSGRINLLWASPECTHHSVARGGRPCSDQSRASAWHVLKWASELYVDRIIVENVPEFESWGPLGADCKPLAGKRGETFRAWVHALKSIGYRVEWRVLCAADYGDPTTRRRLFVQAARGRSAISWPDQTHAEPGNVFALQPWRTAREIIDWSLPCQSVLDRRRPLAENTLRRIEYGIRKYWGQYADPFLVMLRGTGGRQIEACARSLGQPLPTVTAGGGHAGLVQPLIVQSEHGMRVRTTDRPMNTITTSSRGFGLVQPFILHQMTGGRPRSIDEPVPTITTISRHGVVQPFIVHYYGTGGAQGVHEPLSTVTTRDRFGLVEPWEIDIGFRMLQPCEMAAAQGFPDGYRFVGTKSDIVRQIGNAVPCNLARALSEAALRGAA